MSTEVLKIEIPSKYLSVNMEAIHYSKSVLQTLFVAVQFDGYRQA